MVLPMPATAFSTLSVTLLHAEQDGGLVFQGEILEVEGLARADADAGELGADFLLLRPGGRELEGEVEVVKEVRLRDFLVALREIDLRRGGGAGCLRKAESG